MKNIVKVCFTAIVLSFIFYIPVFAETYQADELVRGQHLEAGDVVEFGSGHYQGLPYNKCDILVPNEYDETWTWLGFATLYQNESVTMAEDMYVYDLLPSGENTWLWVLLERIKVNTSLGFGEDNGIEVKREQGEPIRITISPEGGIPPYRYNWRIDYGKDNAAVNLNYIRLTTTDNYFDIPDAAFVSVRCYVIDSKNPNAKRCGTAPQMLITYNTLNIQNPISQDIIDDENSESEMISDDSDEGSIPQTPSTVPNGTVQVSISTDNKTYSNIKALNQFPHDAVNQKIIADLYAAKLKKRTDVLMQKNLFPPHGVKNDWKSAPHTVKWNNLNVKKGDNIIIVWYTPAYWGHTANLQVIPATVVVDGTIEFTIPSMGDMSVMSIFKLK